MQDPPKLFYAKNLSDANFPRDPEGRVYHLGVKHGEVANRILSVGEGRRAKILADLMDNPSTVFCLKSTREFTIYTGTVNGVPVSIIATGMGLPMMDFVVRETRAIIDGPIVMARFGTCGTPQPSVPIGAVAVAGGGSTCITRNFDSFHPEHPEAEAEGGEKKSALSHYDVCRPVAADPVLSELITKKLEEAGIKNVSGLNASADSFYCSQGRVSSYFEDNNDTLIDELVEKYPQLVSLEMETFQLLHLAACSKGVMSASAACIVLAQRRSNEMLATEEKVRLEVSAGRAVLQALSEYPLPAEHVMNGPECVWNKGN